MSNKPLKPVVMAAGALVLGSLALANSAFAMTPLAQGYLLSAGDAVATPGDTGDGHDHAAAEGDDKAKEEGKCGEGKCGEGQCGDDKADADADGKAKEEGKCGEGKCGEGKCGDDKAGDEAGDKAGDDTAEDKDP